MGKVISSGRTALGDMGKAMSDDEIVNWLMGKLIKDASIFKSPIRIVGTTVYCFNTDWVYKESTVLKGRNGLTQFDPSNVSEYFDYRVWVHATTMFKVGMSLEECLHIYVHATIAIERAEPVALNQFVTKVEAPEVLYNKGDMSRPYQVLITVNLARYLYPTLPECIAAFKHHKKEINQKVKRALLADTSMEKIWGVRKDNLRINDILFKKDFTVDYIFDIIAPATA